MGAMKAITVYMEGFWNGSMFSNAAMTLVMFADACEHVACLCRVLRQFRGNSFLPKVGR
jgi:hypothetical protein